jgi:phage tail protein X
MMGNADEHTGAWLTRVQDRIAQAPPSREARLLNMEAECRGGQVAPCLAEAESVLATSPDNATALAWKGIAQTTQAMTGPIANRAPALAEARRTLAHALQLDGQAPLPTMAYFQSFAKAGDPIPEQAMVGVARLAIANPAAPMPRLYLASELLREGKVSQAESIIAPVLHCPCTSPEKALAEHVFSNSTNGGEKMSGSGTSRFFDE